MSLLGRAARTMLAGALAATALSDLPVAAQDKVRDKVKVRMYAAIFAAGALGYGLNLLFLLVERRFVHWTGK